MYPMVYNMAAEQITEDRIKAIKKLMQGPYPGAMNDARPTGQKEVIAEETKTAAAE